MNIVWKQKKERSESNQKILIHSNVSKFLKKKHTNAFCKYT